MKKRTYINKLSQTRTSAEIDGKIAAALNAEVTLEEFKTASRRLPRGKAPGPTMVANMLKSLDDEFLELMRTPITYIWRPNIYRNDGRIT
jgi:hypothetical protein